MLITLQELKLRRKDGREKKGWERGERGERAPPVYPRNHHQKSTLIQSSENP